VLCCLTVFAVVFNVMYCSVIVVCVLRNVCSVCNTKHKNFTSDVSEFYFYMYGHRTKVLTFQNAVLKYSVSICKLPQVFHILLVHHNVTIIFITKSGEIDSYVVNS
jgi:hypothetical protein